MKPAAEAIACAGLSPGITHRSPYGSLRVWPRANDAPLGSGASGSVSRRPAGSMISRLIQTG
ncbi:hypothetical protein ACVWZW_000729 [Bradyrhizobium sp. F1.13.4]